MTNKVIQLFGAPTAHLDKWAQIKNSFKPLGRHAICGLQPTITDIPTIDKPYFEILSVVAAATEAAAKVIWDVQTPWQIMLSGTGLRAQKPREEFEALMDQHFGQISLSVDFDGYPNGYFGLARKVPFDYLRYFDCPNIYQKMDDSDYCNAKALCLDKDGDVYWQMLGLKGPLAPAIKRWLAYLVREHEINGRIKLVEGERMLMVIENNRRSLTLDQKFLADPTGSHLPEKS